MRRGAPYLDCVRRDPTRALVNAETAIALAGDFNLPTWRMIGALNLSQARAFLAANPTDLNELRAKLAQGVGLPEIHRSYLAEGYAGFGELEPALALASQALAGIEAKGLHAFLREAHRVRGEILLKRGPADPAPAEQAIQSAVAVARAQGSRSFGLRAALSLAKLYQSTGRPNDAYAVLALALEGFSPTPQLPGNRRRGGVAGGARTMVCQGQVCATIGRSNLDRPTRSSATRVSASEISKSSLASRSCGRCASTEGPDRAVNPISRSQWNDGLGADSSPSRSDPCRRTFRPEADDSRGRKQRRVAAIPAPTALHAVSRSTSLGSKPRWRRATATVRPAMPPLTIRIRSSFAIACPSPIASVSDCRVSGQD
jgi:hypothetical protein